MIALLIYGACTAICGKVVPGAMGGAAAKHLVHSYGTLAERVVGMAQVNFLYLSVGDLGGYVLIILYVLKEKRHENVR